MSEQLKNYSDYRKAVRAALNVAKAMRSRQSEEDRLQFLEGTIASDSYFDYRYQPQTLSPHMTPQDLFEHDKWYGDGLIIYGKDLRCYDSQYDEAVILADIRDGDGMTKQQAIEYVQNF